MLQAQKGAWIGAKLGLCKLKGAENVVIGHVDVDCFQFV